MAQHKDDIIERVTALSLPILDSLQLELVDVEFKRSGREAVLRLFIDKEGE